MGISSAILSHRANYFLWICNFQELVGPRCNSPYKLSGAIMYTSMFWLNFAGGTAFVLLGATVVVMIGVL